MEQFSTPTDYAISIAERQYFHTDKEGNPTEDYDGMLRRVARHIARAEAIDEYKADHGEYPDWYNTMASKKEYFTDPDKLDAWIQAQGYTPIVLYWERKFYELMRDRKFMPAGRILAGAESSHGQMLNCYVVGPNGRYLKGAKGDPDSVDGIWEVGYKLAKITKTGGGNGVWLGFLREKGSYINGSDGNSSGPVSFLRHNFAQTLNVIKQGGTRRGAGMATLNIDHPDTLDFLTAKDLDREAVEGKIQSFNISLLVSDAFMEAVENNEMWSFRSVVDGSIVPPSPVEGKYHLPGEEPTSVSGNPSDKATSKEIPLYAVRPHRDPARLLSLGGWDGSIDLMVPARWLFNEIAEHAWATGDPGVIFVDRINEFNPLLKELGPIRSTNPCGEQPLYEGESCCLGSMVLSSYVHDFDPSKNGMAIPTSDGGQLGTHGRFDFKSFREDVQIAVRFLDNVLTMNAHPIEDTEEAAASLRRIGLGIMGDADMVIRMGLPFYSEEARTHRSYLARVLRNEALRASEELAMTKDPFPLWDKSTLRRARRNVFVLSIAPTGTISMISDTSSGIEPIYALNMMRKVGDTYLPRLHPLFEAYLEEEAPEMLEDEVEHRVAAGTDASGKPYFRNMRMPRILKKILENGGTIRGLNEFSKEEQDLWATAHDVPVEGHVAVQALYQQELDGADGASPMASISKTINLPQSATIGDVQEVYRAGYKARLKGLTMYRDGSRQDQVLRTDSDEEKIGLEDVKDDVIEPDTCRNCDADRIGVCWDCWQDWDGVEDKGCNCGEKIAILEDELASALQHCRMPTSRGAETYGKMVKAEFRHVSGKSRKVYGYIGTNKEHEPVEAFITDAQGDPELRAYADALGMMVSMLLKNGVPAEEVEERLIGIAGPSVSYSGAMYQSVPDFIGKLLQRARQEKIFEDFVDALDEEDTSREPAAVEADGTSGTVHNTFVVSQNNNTQTATNNPVCSECGESTIIIMDGCPTCTTCGHGKCA